MKRYIVHTIMAPVQAVSCIAPIPPICMETPNFSALSVWNVAIQSSFQVVRYAGSKCVAEAGGISLNNAAIFLFGYDAWLRIQVRYSQTTFDMCMSADVWVTFDSRLSRYGNDVPMSKAKGRFY